MDLLDAEADGTTREEVGAVLTPKENLTLLKPVQSANYTDFYASDSSRHPSRPALPSRQSAAAQL
jgi:hypothetical protein